MSELRFDDFQIGKTIGVGTVGTIYAVTRQRHGQGLCAQAALAGRQHRSEHRAPL